MEEKDIFAMLPNKVGPARKVSVLVKQLQMTLKAVEESLIQHHNGGFQIVEIGSDDLEVPPPAPALPPPPAPASLLPPPAPASLLPPLPALPAPSSGSPSPPPQSSSYEVEIDSCVESCTTDVGLSAQCQKLGVDQYVPNYSPIISSLLKKGEIMKEWDKFIEETAYHVLSVGNFESRGLYADLGRLMYHRYPCIGHKALKEPWTFFNQKLSQKVRNIRWRWNARSKGNIQTKKKKSNAVVVMDKDDSMGEDAAEKALSNELMKPTKLIDRALVARAQRVTFKTRRTFITQTHDGKIGSLVKKFPFLAIAEFIEKEFQLIKPGHRDRWGEIFPRLRKIIARAKSRDGQDELDESSELEVLIEVQEKMSKGKARSPLITQCKMNEINLKTRADDAPRLVAVKDETDSVTNCFIVGGGVDILASSNVKNAIALLVKCYYAWDLSYPKCYQLLGFTQYYVLGDKENKFSMSANYLKFTKEFEDN